MTLDLVPIGLAIAFDPIPLTMFMVVLPARRGVRQGAAFVFGCLVSLAIVVAATMLATGHSLPRPPKWHEHVDHMSVWFALGLAPV